MPVSSFEIATTGTLYFLTSGRTSSSRSSSPVTEFSSGRPCAVSRPLFSAPGTELSMQSLYRLLKKNGLRLKDLKNAEGLEK